jgi:hypothetical protein
MVFGIFANAALEEPLKVVLLDGFEFYHGQFSGELYQTKASEIDVTRFLSYLGIRMILSLQVILPGAGYSLSKASATRHLLSGNLRRVDLQGAA